MIRPTIEDTELETVSTGVYSAARAIFRSGDYQWLMYAMHSPLYGRIYYRRVGLTGWMPVVEERDAIRHVLELVMYPHGWDRDFGRR